MLYNIIVYIILYNVIYIYRQHIRQSQHQRRKFEEQFWTCGKGEFKIFSFFKLHSQNKYLRELYEKYFWNKFKPTLHKYLKGIKFRGYLVSRLEENCVLLVFNFAIWWLQNISRVFNFTISVKIGNKSQWISIFLLLIN